MHALPRHRTAVRRKQKDFRPSAAGRTDHPLADSESHFARGEIRNDNDQPANELPRRVRALDAREDVAAYLATEVQSQLHQFVRSLDVRRRNDPRDAQVNLREIVDRAEIGDQRFFWATRIRRGRPATTSAGCTPTPCLRAS